MRICCHEFCASTGFDCRFWGEILNIDITKQLGYTEKKCIKRRDCMIGMTEHYENIIRQSQNSRRDTGFEQNHQSHYHSVRLQS